MKLKTKVGAFLGALALVVSGFTTVQIVTASEASAGECEAGGTVCGYIFNQANSPRSLPVTCALAYGDAGGTGATWQANHDSAFADYRETAPGTQSGCKDADGFHVPWGYYAKMWPGTLARCTKPAAYFSCSGAEPAWTTPGVYRVEYNASPNHWIKVTSAESVGVRLYKYPAGQGPSRCCGD